MASLWIRCFPFIKYWVGGGEGGNEQHLDHIYHPSGGAGELAERGKMEDVTQRRCEELECK